MVTSQRKKTLQGKKIIKTYPLFKYICKHYIYIFKYLKVTIAITTKLIMLILLVMYWYTWHLTHITDLISSCRQRNKMIDTYTWDIPLLPFPSFPFPSHIFLDQITGQCSLKLNLLWMCTVHYPYFRLQMSRTGETLHWLDTGTVVAYWYALPLTTDPLESPRSS